MQVGISQIILPELSTAEFLQQAGRAGYEVAELTMRPQGDLTPQTGPEELQGIVDQARAAGVRLVSMCHSHCTGNLLDRGENARRSINETITGLKAAKAMGIGCTLHTLGRQRADLYYDDAYRHAVANLKEIARAGEDLGVTLAVEFVWNGFLFSPLEMRRFLDEIGSERIGFYFDPGNMAVFQYPHHWVRIVGPHIKMVHLKDWQGGPLKGSWPALLEGQVDYAAINRELRAIGYDGPMISEVGPADCPIEKTAQAIRKIMAM